jgi:hypothetical protein
LSSRVAGLAVLRPAETAVVCAPPISALARSAHAVAVAHRTTWRVYVLGTNVGLSGVEGAVHLIAIVHPTVAKVIVLCVGPCVHARATLAGDERAAHPGGAAERPGAPIHGLSSAMTSTSDATRLSFCWPAVSPPIRPSPVGAGPGRALAVRVAGRPRLRVLANAVALVAVTT